MRAGHERTPAAGGSRPKRATNVPSTAPPALLRLQQVAGNRAVAALVAHRRLARTPSGVGGLAATVRRIVLDANAFDQLRRGNIMWAKTFRELAANNEVFVSWQAVHEWVGKGRNAQASTVKRIIEEFGLKITPPAPRSVVDELRIKNVYTTGNQGETRMILTKEKDLLVAAEAKAIDAEVLSFDGAFRNGAVVKTLGVKVAKEPSTLAVAAAKAATHKGKDARTLRVLGIKGDPVAGELPQGKVTPAAGSAGGAIKDAEEAASGTVVKETEKAAGGAVVKETQKAAGGAVVKETEKVAAAVVKDVEKGGKLWTRLTAKLGVKLLDSMIPDPLDAIGLMMDFAEETYEGTRQAIRGDNLRDGFAIGFAAYLVIPRWEWTKGFAHSGVSRDVGTQVADAVGIAENAFNEGLVRGYLYGEKHTTNQADAVRQKAFGALQKLGHTPGRDDGNDLYTFGRDDVYAFAGVLLPTATQVLAEADRRKENRLESERESERLRQQMERWSRFPIGADKW